VRDDLGGAGGWDALGASGVTIRAGESFDFGLLGEERIGSDLSIAVDPADPDRVAVAYAARLAADTTVFLRTSSNGGQTWTERFGTVPDTALPAVAIAANGNVGLLYTRFYRGSLETRLRQWKPDFTATTDEVLARFPNGVPVPQYSPYIGDTQDLEAHGNVFLGAFCASNDTSDFPNPPILLREGFRLGSEVPYSIDPYFFRADVEDFP
jgi:hypothetical protein